jgi:hypothetical protein
MKYVPIVILLVIIAAGAGYIFLGASEKDSSPEPDTALEMASLQSDLDQVEADRAQLQTELAAAEERILELETDAALAADAVDTEAEDDPAEEDSEADDEDGKPSLDDIRAKLSESPAAKMQFKALTELLYADFLNGVEMDAETKAAIRELLGESFTETIALSQYAMQKGDVTWADVRDWTLQEREILDKQIRGQLSDEAYATWSEYAVDMDARQLDGNLRNQIRMLASGLTDDNFEMVMDVAVQEFLAEQTALEQSDELFTMAENVNYQLRAMDAMADRLQGVLSEEQFAELQNFITFGENALNAQLAAAQQ